jgi:hypothetical protein
MRASLLHPLREPRHPRGNRRGHRLRADDAIAREPVAAPAPKPAPLRDPDAQRVREAGGPVDLASYTCSCGYLFSASVSTSVACPHCGAYQAW